MTVLSLHFLSCHFYLNIFSYFQLMCWNKLAVYSGNSRAPTDLPVAEGGWLRLIVDGEVYQGEVDSLMWRHTDESWTLHRTDSGDNVVTPDTAC